MEYARTAIIAHLFNDSTVACQGVSQPGFVMGGDVSVSLSRSISTLANHRFLPPTSPSGLTSPRSTRRCNVALLTPSTSIASPVAGVALIAVGAGDIGEARAIPAGVSGNRPAKQPSIRYNDPAVRY